MAMKGCQNKTDSPKMEVGEIDTGAPFQSVKDAVNLFGEKITIKKIKPHSAARVLVKETKLNLVQKEIYKLKERLKIAETTKTDALTELEQAKGTLDDLTKKLEIINKAKEAATNQSNQFESIETNLEDRFNQDLDNPKQHYAAVFTEVDAAKQELRRIGHDCETAIEEQNEAIKQETKFNLIKKVNLDRKLAHKVALEESAKKLLALQKQVDPETSTQFAEKTCEIKRLQTEMETARGSDLDSLKTVTLELDDAKDSLLKAVEEESLLKKLLESLKIELENVKNEHKELKEKEAESKLKIALTEADEAKKAESKTFEGIKINSERADAACSTTLESGSIIIISREEFEALSRKVVESEKRAEMKAEAARREIDELEAALRSSEAAETCKKAMEGELKRWREREEKKAADAVALILEETHLQQQTPSLASTPNYKQSPPHKQKTNKTIRISSFSGMFHRKKSQVDVGSSPSYLPGEKPV